MPCVTVCPTPNGLPTASTRSPTCSASESPSSSTCRSVAFFKPEHREIGARIAQHDLGLEFAPVRKRHLHLVHVLDDVVVGDDEARRIHDDAGAKRALRPPGRHARAALPEEPPEEILHAGILAPLGAAWHRRSPPRRWWSARSARRTAEPAPGFGATRAVLRLRAGEAGSEKTSGREGETAESGTHEDEYPIGKVTSWHKTWCAKRQIPAKPHRSSRRLQSLHQRRTAS